jgi:hypothetical protein
MVVIFASPLELASNRLGDLFLFQVDRALRLLADKSELRVVTLVLRVPAVLLKLPQVLRLQAIQEQLLFPLGRRSWVLLEI